MAKNKPAQPRAQTRRSRHSAASTRNGNRILASLPAPEYDRLEPHLESSSLEQRAVLWEPNTPIDAVYFPIDAVASILAVTNEGMAVEIGTVGNEGLVGLPVFLGATSSPGRAIIQIAGDVYRLDAQIFRREAARESHLRRLIHVYTQLFMTQVAQSTACNRIHTTEQRLARWLLVVADRVGQESYPLTQEFMAQMLGVRRATVTEAAGALQAAKLIRYSRGVMTILDRAALEQASCGCYWIVRNEFEQLLGRSMG
jgi:CRP-like cAMP-binding protein